MKRVNLGCGSVHHPDWINLDLRARDADVIEHDVRTGLPFRDAEVDVCYSSHVLEHMGPDDGEVFITEQRRVLRPGGIIRVLVPDLEVICRNYLMYLDSVVSGDDCEFEYDYTILELLEQMTRERPGGRMADVWERPLTESEATFVVERHGMEAERVLARTEGERRKRSSRPIETGLSRPGGKRARIAEAVLGLLLGEEHVRAYRLGLFRLSGEVHRHMYDRYSLSRLLTAVGFADVEVRAAGDSRIPGFARFDLEVVEGRVRKPDSLFVEAVAP